MSATIFFGLIILGLAVVDIAITAIAAIREWGSMMSALKIQVIQEKLASLFSRVGALQDASLRMDTSLNTLTNEVETLESAIDDALTPRADKPAAKKK